MKKNIECINMLVEHVQRELKLAGFLDENSDDYRIGKSVIEIIDFFSKKEYSYDLAIKIGDLFKKLIVYECISPLTGKDDEWIEISNKFFQNKRIDNVFKDKNNVYYCDAIIWCPYNKKYSFIGIVENVSSKQFIRSFPFVPKTFYIDVIKKNNEFKIKNKNQLKKVYEYYKG